MWGKGCRETKKRNVLFNYEPREQTMNMLRVSEYKASLDIFPVLCESWAARARELKAFGGLTPQGTWRLMGESPEDRSDIVRSRTSDSLSCHVIPLSSSCWTSDSIGLFYRVRSLQLF